jgi:hypothetical protein
MKVRWTRENLRLRITPTELGSLVAGESICERFVVAGKTVWAITLAATEGRTSLTTNPGSVDIALSKLDRQALSAPEREGVYFTAVGQDGSSLRYYVEKDFPCIHPTEGELMDTQTETFPRP